MAAIMTVFAPKTSTELWGTRFWGDQVVRYACYELEDGTFLGDRANKVKLPCHFLYFFSRLHSHTGGAVSIEPACCDSRISIGMPNPAPDIAANQTPLVSSLLPPTQGYTKECIKLGWVPPEPKTGFDVLPIVIQRPNEAPRVYELPPEAALQVNLTHPNFPEFGEMGLKWVAVPAISSFRVSIGGIDYCMATLCSTSCQVSVSFGPLV